MLVFEDETIVTQKPCIRKSMSFEGEQQKVLHNGSRSTFSMYISMIWPEQKLMYDFYDRMDSNNTINYLENLKIYAMKKVLKLLLVWDNASFHVSRMTHEYVKAQKD